MKADTKVVEACQQQRPAARVSHGAFKGIQIAPPLTRMLSYRRAGGRVEGSALLCFLELVFWPLTTHRFRDRASFLLLILVEIPPTSGRSLRFPHLL